MLVTASSAASLLLLLSAATSLIQANNEDPRINILSNADGTRYNYCQAPFPNSDTHPEPKARFVNGSVLTSVQMFIRHGDRTPTSAIEADVNVTWDCDNLGSYIYTSAENHLDPGNSIKFTNAVARQVIVSPRKSPFSRYNWKGSCTPGQLTPLGAQQHRTLGATLREIYVNRWKFLPAEFDPSALYVRSTEGRPPVFQMEVVPSAVEYMKINSHLCPKAKKLERAIKGSASYKQVQAEARDISEDAREIIGPDVSLQDAVLPRLCHNLEPYCEDGQPDRCITPAIGDLVSTKSALETAALYRDAPESREYLRLGMGPLAKDIVDNFVTATQRTTVFRRSSSTVPQFKLYSGHDTTIAPLLGLLESTDMRWPPYASNLIFELWTAPSGERFVRIFQNGNVMQTTTKWCNLEWCPMSQFAANMEKYIPQDILDECETEY
ncbi:Acid phosphatase-like protein 2 [Podila clonocystis]|nr:Acid phosphatase-like protein 2 [Podila clonocystis]